jgi:hypothetical protein
MDLHLFPSLETTTIVCASFDILMSKGGVDTFALVINYLDKVGFHNMLLFEVQEINALNLCVHIHLLGGRPMRVNFQMLTSLPNKFLGLQGFKLRLKECST